MKLSDPQRFALWALGATAVAALAARAAVKRRTVARKSMIERSIVINMPSAQAADALGAVAGGAGPASLGLNGERAGISWNLRLEDYDGKRRTRLVAMLERGSGGFLPDSAVGHLVTTELRNMKALLETGEIATVAGQAEGERSFVGSSLTKVATRARRALDEIAKRQLTEAHT